MIIVVLAEMIVMPEMFLLERLIMNVTGGHVFKSEPMNIVLHSETRVLILHRPTLLLVATANVLILILTFIVAIVDTIALPLVPNKVVIYTAVMVSVLNGE
jgi:hypothetical protein